MNPFRLFVDLCGVSVPTMRGITDLETPLGVDIAVMKNVAASRSSTCSLHICPDCDSRLVQPTRWAQESSRSHWRLWRRCPECNWAGEGVHDQVAVDAYDEQLDLGALKLGDELQVLERANMREMAQVFIVALQRDLIGPDDFQLSTRE